MNRGGKSLRLGRFPLWIAALILFALVFGLSLHVTRMVLELSMENGALSDQLAKATSDVQRSVGEQAACVAKASAAAKSDSAKIFELEVKLRVKEEQLTKLRQEDGALGGLQQQLAQAQQEYKALMEAQQVHVQRLRTELDTSHTEDPCTEVIERERQCQDRLELLEDELRQENGNQDRAAREVSSADSTTDNEALRTELLTLRDAKNALQRELDQTRSRSRESAEQAGRYEALTQELTVMRTKLTEKETEVKELNNKLVELVRQQEDRCNELEKQFDARVEGHLRSHAVGKRKGGHAGCGTDGKCQVLITGTARSGTSHISKVFTLAGFDLPHEHLGADGIVDWQRGSDSLGFAAVLQQVRHPLQVIASCTTLKPRSWERIDRLIGVPQVKAGERVTPLLKCMHYWYYWNSLVEKVADWVYRIEDTDYKDICLKAGFPERRCHLSDWEKAATTSRTANSRSHEDVTWATLSALNPQLTRQIKKLAEHYGYVVGDEDSSAHYALDIDKDED